MDVLYPVGKNIVGALAVGPADTDTKGPPSALLLPSLDCPHIPTSVSLLISLMASTEGVTGNIEEEEGRWVKVWAATGLCTPQRSLGSARECANASVAATESGDGSNEGGRRKGKGGANLVVPTKGLGFLPVTRLSIPEEETAEISVASLGRGLPPSPLKPPEEEDEAEGPPPVPAVEMEASSDRDAEGKGGTNEDKLISFPVPTQPSEGSWGAPWKQTWWSGESSWNLCSRRLHSFTRATKSRTDKSARKSGVQGCWARAQRATRFSLGTFDRYLW
mmetsp:Transcript_21686/g.43118  ORF Transcript_21686/g.43118 Transcript_21686/m.43118 type:complete len:277 (-) Transcript_21686:178-1008(-)